MRFSTNKNTMTNTMAKKGQKMKKLDRNLCDVLGWMKHHFLFFFK